MKRNDGLILFLGLILSLALAFVYFYKDHIDYKEDNIIKNHIDSYLNELFNKIKEKKRISLIAANLIADNKEIKECLSKNNVLICKQLLKNTKDIFNKMQFAKDMRLHLHTKDFRSFIRNWDTNNSNDNLVYFRNSLQIIKSEKQSISGVEIGKYSLLLRGIAPVFDNNIFLGSVEAIFDFEDITNYFRKKDIDFFVLMYSRYEKIASYIKYPKNKKFNNFIIINDINSGLEDFSDVSFKETSYAKRNNTYIAYTPIYDISNNKVGFYVLKFKI